jgi:hypothetical protein
MFTRTRLPLLLLPLLVACATPQPVLLQAEAPPPPAAQARAHSDVQQCLRLADERVGRNALHAPKGGKKAVEQTAQVAGVAFLGTAVAASVGRSQEVWQRARGAAAGGATAMGLKLLIDWHAPDEVYEKQVEHCLERRGHEVAGWR